MSRRRPARLASPAARPGDGRRGRVTPPGPAPKPWALPGRGTLAVVIALLAVAPYLNALTAGFAFDDIPFILRNAKVMAQEPALGLLTWIDRPDLYRPLTMLTYAANVRLGGGAAAFHVVNVLLHAAVSVLAFLLLERLAGGLALAAATAGLFAVHPIHTEAVTGIVGRAELLAALFGLLALLALARGAREVGRARLTWSLASATALAAAVLSKESAVTFVPLGLVLWLWLRGWAAWRSGLAALVPHGAMLVAYLAWRASLVGALTTGAPPAFIDNPLAHVAAPVRLATAVVILAQYLGLLTLPLTLSSDYSYDQVPLVTSATDPRLLAALAVLLALTAALAILARRAPVLGLAGLLFAIPLALTANILFPIGTIKAERLLYAPSLGWCLAAGWVVVQLARVRVAVSLAVLAVVATAMGVRTWERNRDWRDELAAHAAAVRTAPRSAKTLSNWGTDLVRQRRYAEAIPFLRRSLEIYPDRAAVRTNLGGALMALERFEEALPHLERAVALEPGSPQMRRNLGQALGRLGRTTDALPHYEAAVRLDPASVDARYALGTLLLQAGRAAEAGEQFEAVVRASPRHADAHSNWGVALSRQGRMDEAIARFEEALRIDPRHAQAETNLGRARSRRTP